MFTQDGRVASIRTITIPRYTATDEQMEAIRRESTARYGMPLAQSRRHVEETSAEYRQEPSLEVQVPAYEMMSIQGRRLQRFLGAVM